MTSIEDLKKEKAATDDEIAGLKVSINQYEEVIFKGGVLTEGQRGLLTARRDRLSELTRFNTALNQHIVDLEMEIMKRMQLQPSRIFFFFSCSLQFSDSFFFFVFFLPFPTKSLPAMGRIELFNEE